MSRNEELLSAAVTACSGHVFFYKFISANDAGVTNSHQSGIYMPKTCWRLFGQETLSRGSNITRDVTIHWQEDGMATAAHAKYYGTGTRNECRVTSDGHRFPDVMEANIGSLLVMVGLADNDFAAFVIDDGADQIDFLAATGATASTRGTLVDESAGSVTVLGQVESAAEEALFSQFVRSLRRNLPRTETLGDQAREISHRLRRTSATRDPDAALLDWYDTEYRLFLLVEREHYADALVNPFESLEAFLHVANSMLNSRKTRAGHSLEHHLARIFADNGLRNSHGQVTEKRKRPDFVFPGIQQYRDANYPVARLVVLAAKTTCKERWTEILNEADRLRDGPHYLVTLQPGINPSQLDTMYSQNVVIVSPHRLHVDYPPTWRDRLLTVQEFVEQTRTAVAVRTHLQEPEASAGAPMGNGHP